MTQSAHDVAEPRWTWMASAAGTLWVLALFMADAWAALPGGRNAVMDALPVAFPWPAFISAVTMMAVPVAWRLRGVRARVAA